jgi:hypothetical protein
MSRAVLGIEHPQEAMNGSLTVDGHELCDPRAAVVELGARAARLNNRNADPEGCNFLRDRFQNRLSSLFSPSPRVSLACAMRSTQRGIWVPRRASELSPRVLTLIFAHIPEERWKLGNAARWCD